MPGVFVSRRTTFAIPPGGLTLRIDKNRRTTGTLTPHLHFDVTTTWLELAVRHLAEARQQQTARAIAWSQNGDPDAKAKTLEAEFEASMQAIMAAAIALDAFYAVIQENVALPNSLFDNWRKNRTARYKQVSEVMRVAFSVNSNDAARSLCRDVEQIYKLRDRAVHPSGKLSAPVLHPELQVWVEWRFVSFRYQSAAAVVEASLRVLRELATAGKPKNQTLKQYAENLRSIVERLANSLTATEATADERR